MGSLPAENANDRAEQTVQRLTGRASRHSPRADHSLGTLHSEGQIRARCRSQRERRQEQLCVARARERQHNHRNDTHGGAA